MRSVALCLAVALASVGRAPGQEPAPGPATRPAWAVEGMPDTVRALVEASAAARDDGRAKRLLREAETEARRAVAGDSSDVARRFALAVVLGLRADREGGKTKVRAAAALHEELRAILGREPEHARARHMLGRLHAGVRRMNGVVRWIATRLLGGDVLADASWEEAELHLGFAERHAPEVADHHLQLANLYRDTGRPDLALEEVRHVLALPAGSAMERAVRAEAVELRRELGG